MNVILNDDYNTSVGRCDINIENGETVGTFSLQTDVPDTMYVYYRHNIPENFFYAIQLRDKPLPDKKTLTIAELIR